MLDCYGEWALRKVARYYNRPWWEMLEIPELWIAEEAELIDVHEEIAAVEVAKAEAKWRT